MRITEIKLNGKSAQITKEEGNVVSIPLKDLPYAIEQLIHILAALTGKNYKLVEES